MITGEIKRFLRDDGMIKVSRSLKEMAMKARTLQENYHTTKGRDPTLEELAEEIGVTSEELAVALDSVSEVESLQKTIYQGDGSAISLMDKLEQEEKEDERVIDRLVLSDLFHGLTKEEQTIIALRYFYDKTQTQIAKKLGISQVQVSRLEKKILKQMREKMV